MNAKQLHAIFDGRDSNEDIHKNFEAIGLTSTQMVHVQRYKTITIDFGNELLIVEDTNPTTGRTAKQFIDFVDINMVREIYNSPSEEFDRASEWLSM